jgi:hypothetical protein
MPEMRYFIVRQVREVKVWANTPVSAAQIGDAAFRGYHPSDALEGATTSEVRDVDLIVQEAR